MSIFDPHGRRIFTSTTKGRMARQGPPDPQPARRTDAGRSTRNRRSAGPRRHNRRLGARRPAQGQPDHRLSGAGRAARDRDEGAAEDQP
jgi:hypothetical protein